MIIGLTLFGAFAVCLIIGVPISISLGVATLVTILSHFDLSLGIITQRLFAAMDTTSIMAIPFFVLAGNLMTQGGISKRLVDFTNRIVGNIRGGMSFAMILACAFFAALSGSAPATVIAIGVMLYPDMVKLGYPKGKTAGLLAVAGGLGPIIPPSIIMIVYATLTGASVGGMFKAGMVDGFLIVLALFVVTAVIAKKEKWPKNDVKFSISELAKAFLHAIPALLLPIIILGGIYSGLFTATEAAAVSVVWALVVGLFVYKELKVRDLWNIILSSGKSAAMVLFIIATSTAFSWLFTYSGLAGMMVEAITRMNLSPAMYCFIVAIVLLIFGTFLEGVATAVLLVPILWPVAQSLGVDVIHFGMIVSISNVVGTMTPPVAVNIFSAASVTKLKMGEIVEGEIPFFIAYLACFFIVVFFPQVSLLLV
jgi:C4-dicarboxylate transporter DctM subunit